MPLLPRVNSMIPTPCKILLIVWNRVYTISPENRALENAALSLAKNTAEQKTAIYILTKQANIGELASKLNAANKNVKNKPEVYFVKYRTPEDAENAQKAI